jgi:hypothetical protein
MMSTVRPADFLCQQIRSHQFSISPCTFNGLVWLHENALTREATYDGEPITLDFSGILNLTEKASMEGFEIVFLNADLSKLKRELSNNGS